MVVKRGKTDSLEAILARMRGHIGIAHLRPAVKIDELQDHVANLALEGYEVVGITWPDDQPRPVMEIRRISPKGVV